MTNVLVSGAASPLGRSVVSTLQKDQGFSRLIAVDRRRMNAGKKSVELVRLDLLSNDWPQDLFENVDVIIHAAWIVGTDGGASDSSNRNVDTVRLLLDEAERTGVKQIVICSDAAVYGAWPDNDIPLSEDAQLRPNPGYSYGEQLLEVEKLVDAFAAEHPDTIVSVLRPALTVSGSREAPVARTLGITRAVRIEDPDRPVQFVHVEDVATAVRVVIHAKARGVFNVAPDGWLSDEQARELSGTPFRRGLPWPIAPVVERVFHRAGRAEAAPESAPYRTYPWVIDNAKLRSLGWNPAYTNAEALVDWPAVSLWSALRPHDRRKLITVGGSLVGLVSTVVVGAVTRRKLSQR